eukprot:6176774-Pleurochrysis_carterae.AAC.2
MYSGVEASSPASSLLRHVLKFTKVHTDAHRGAQTHRRHHTNIPALERQLDVKMQELEHTDTEACARNLNEHKRCSQFNL